MSIHRYDNDIEEVKTYFNLVIDWVSSLFYDVESEMRGIEWGRLYESYKETEFDIRDLNQKVRKYYGDGYVKNRKGIWEYVLSNEHFPNLLDIRLFDEPTKKIVYVNQTKIAKETGNSNCPSCVVGFHVNKSKVWKIDEMDADHVTPWTKGGSTSIENCQLLCKPHNRAKGNK